MKRWTKDEKNFLKKYWSVMQAKDIAQMLGKTEYAIYGKTKKMFPSNRKPAGAKKIVTHMDKLTLDAPPELPKIPERKESVEMKKDTPSVEIHAGAVSYLNPDQDFPEIENYLRVIHRTLPKHWGKIPLEQRNTILKGVLNMMIWCF